MGHNVVLDLIPAILVLFVLPVLLLFGSIALYQMASEARQHRAYDQRQAQIEHGKQVTAGRRAEAQQTQTRAQEQARQDKARVDAELAEMDERKRRDGWIELAQKQPGLAIELIDQIPQRVDRAVELLMQAEVEFATPLYGPFWNTALATLSAIEDIQRLLGQIVSVKQMYYRAAENAEGELPPFIDLSGLDETETILQSLRDWLQRVVNEAHSDAHFSMIYASMRIESAVRQGFDRLENTLIQIDRSINNSTTILSAGLEGIRRKVSELESAVKSQSNSSLSHDLLIVREIRSGMGKATGAITKSHMDAQNKASISIGELKQIRSRLDNMQHN